MIPTLIADDSIAELDVILYLIKKYALPLEPAVASDGEEALHYIQQSPVELLITDIRMPFMDGLALSAKALAVNPYLKIIISSGYQDFSYAKTAISLGVEEYLLKPIQPQEFTQLILRIADKLEKEKQKRQADNLQLAYSRDQITQQLLRGALRSGKDGMLPREIRSLMPDKGELLLLTAESGSLSSLFNLKAEICQLASQFFNYPARCIPIDSQFLLLAVDFSIPADEECGNAKKRQINLWNGLRICTICHFAELLLPCLPRNSFCRRYRPWNCLSPIRPRSLLKINRKLKTWTLQTERYGLSANISPLIIRRI